MKTKVDSQNGQENEFRPSAMTLQALIAPVVAVLLIFLGVVLSLTLTGARIQDEAEVRRSLQVVQSAFEIIGANLGHQTISLARTDRAADRLAREFDPEWMKIQLQPIRKRYGNVNVIVVDSADSVVFSDSDAEMDRLKDFVARARSLPASPPDSIAGFTTVDGRLYVAATSIIAPASSDGSSAHGMLVLLLPVDESLLAGMSRDFQIEGLRVETPPNIEANIGMRIEPPEGGTMAVITWTPAGPGSALFDYLLVPLVVASLLAGLLLATFLRTAMLTAKQLKKGVVALAESGVALEYSETKLSAIIDGVADGIVTLDDKGLITSANASTYRIFGYDAEELLGQPADKLLVNGPKEVGDAGAAEVLKANPAMAETEYREFSGRRKDGGRFTLDTAISHITHHSTAIAVAIMRDVTERRQAEETLNLLSTGMALVDRDCRLLLANRSASRLFDMGDGLTLSQGRIGAVRRDHLDQLHELVDRACSVHDGETVEKTFTGVMTVDRGDEVRPLSIMVAPVQLGAAAEGDSQVAAIFIRDLEMRQSVPPEVLAKLFGLTPAEARVVVELVKGKRPQEVADNLSVSLNTVRNQLKQIFSKTNTGRQSELISLVLSSVAFVSEHGLVIDDDDGPSPKLAAT